MASSIHFFLEKKCPFVGTESNSSWPLSLFIKLVDGSKKFLKSSLTFGVILNVKPLTDDPIFYEHLSGKIQSKSSLEIYTH